MGVFPRTQRLTDGRFCNAWTGSILKPGLWIMVCLSLGGGGGGSGDSACVTGSGNQEGPMEAASFLNKTSSQLRIADASMLVTHIIYIHYLETQKNY